MTSLMNDWYSNKFLCCFIVFLKMKIETSTNIYFNNWQKIWMDISPKKIYERQINIKNAQKHASLVECKVKPQQDSIITHLIECKH